MQVSGQGIPPQYQAKNNEALDYNHKRAVEKVNQEHGGNYDVEKEAAANNAQLVVNMLV